MHIPWSPSTIDSKFIKFNVTSAPYKFIDEQDIPVHVLIPKGVHTGKQALIVRFHGGLLVTGCALYPEWFPQWSLDYALLHNALIISPEYRLLPESSGLDVLSDLQDFWTWVQNDLQAYLKRIGSDITPDYDKILVYGESAGGYLAIQSALTQPPGLIKAVIAGYPMTDLASSWYTTASSTKSPKGALQMNISIFKFHIAAMEPGKIITNDLPTKRIPLAITILQHGLYRHLLGNSDSLYPLKLVDAKKGDEKVPFLFLYHGKVDSFVPCEQTEEFLRRWIRKFGTGSAVGIFVEGQDHGFDQHATLDTPWLRGGLKEMNESIQRQNLS